MSSSISDTLSLFKDAFDTFEKPMINAREYRESKLNYCHFEVLFAM